MVNEGIAEVFLEIADLLDLEGVRFKPEAYRRAARALLQASEDVATLARSGHLAEVPGIGEALTEKIREYVRTGQVPYREKLRAQWPSGLLEVMRLEGVGPKTTRRFYLEFRVQSVEDLERVLKEGKLRGTAGFGERKIELLTQAVQKRHGAPAGVMGTGERLPLPQAQAIADELLEALRAAGVPAEQILFAGSLRRRRETVGDLDLLATSSQPRAVADLFVHLPAVKEVKLSGETKSTVLLRNGFQVDLRVVPPGAFGAALQYFTGSKEHNIRLRTIANQKGFSLNEYGLKRGNEFLPVPREEDVYAAVGLPWVPPELREDRGEIEAAIAGRLPSLIDYRQLRGELHIHVPASVEDEDLAPWTSVLRAAGLSLAGFVVREKDLRSTGRTVTELRAALPRQRGGVRVLLGWEGEIEAGIPLTASSGADYVCLTPPRRPVADPVAWRSSLRTLAAAFPTHLVHLTPASLAEAGLRWADVAGAATEGSAAEVAVAYDGVLVGTPQVRTLAEVGGRVVLSGLPRDPSELRRLDLAVGIARRGWVPGESVVNARDPPFERSSATPAAAPGVPSGGRPTASRPKVARPRR